MRAVMTLFWIYPLFLMIPSVALPELIVHDIIAIKGREVALSAETRGRFFRRGGELVEFLVNGQSLGNVLSGGDGAAFRTYTPKKASLYRIAAKTGNEEGRGLLLSLEKGTEIVFVDVEGSLMEELFSGKPKRGSQDAVKDIQRRFPVVFLQTGLLSIDNVKAWLKEYGFIESPVLAWKPGAIFDDITGKALRIRAIIGGPDVIESAKGYTTSAFSFGEVDSAREVKGWEEIRRALRP